MEHRELIAELEQLESTLRRYSAQREESGRNADEPTIANVYFGQAQGYEQSADLLALLIGRAK